MKNYKFAVELYHGQTKMMPMNFMKYEHAKWYFDFSIERGFTGVLVDIFEEKMTRLMSELGLEIERYENGQMKLKGLKYLIEVDTPTYENFIQKLRKEVNKDLKEIFEVGVRFNQFEELFEVMRNGGKSQEFVYDFVNNKLGNKPLIQDGFYY